MLLMNSTAMRRTGTTTSLGHHEARHTCSQLGCLCFCSWWELLLNPLGSFLRGKSLLRCYRPSHHARTHGGASIPPLPCFSPQLPPLFQSVLGMCLFFLCLLLVYPWRIGMEFSLVLTALLRPMPHTAGTGIYECRHQKRAVRVCVVCKKANE